MFEGIWLMTCTYRRILLAKNFVIVSSSCRDRKRSYCRIPVFSGISTPGSDQKAFESFRVWCDSNCNKSNRKSHHLFMITLNHSSKYNCSHTITAWLRCVLPAWKLYMLSVSVVTNRCHCSGACPQMNKFEQFSSDHHQMSLVGGRSSGLMLRGYPYHETYPMMHLLLPRATCENRHLWKHYLPATSFAGGKYSMQKADEKNLPFSVSPPEYCVTAESSVLVTVSVTGAWLVCGEVFWCPGVIEPQADSRAPLDLPSACGTMPAHSTSKRSLRNIFMLPIYFWNECKRITQSLLTHSL